MAVKPDIDLKMKNEITEIRKRAAKNKQDEDIKDAKEHNDLEFNRKQQRAYSELKAKGTVALDREGKETGSKWEKMRRELAQQSSSDYANYNTFTTAMMGLLIAYKDYLLEAVMQSRDEAALAIYQFIEQIGRGIYTNLPFGKPGEPEVVLPTLVHCVEMGDDNKLTIGSLGTEDGSALGLGEENEKFTHDIQACLEKGVNAWLHANGWKTVEGSPQQFEKDGVLLTKEEFEKLKNDEENGLTVYLSGKFDMSFTPAPTPTPRP